MTGHHEIICRGLEEFAGRLRTTDCWVSFNANDNEHWIQCARGLINMDWPFSCAPEPQQLQRHLGALSPFEVVSWEADLFATIEIAPSAIETVATVIDRLFRELYELGPDYELSYTLEDF